MNIRDFFSFLRSLRGNDDATFDFDGDGNINYLDFYQFFSRFGRSI